MTDKTLFGLAVFSGWGSNFSASNGLSNLSGFNLSTDNFTYVGNAGRDDMNLNISRSSFLGALDVSTGGGADIILSAKLTNKDKIDLGSGDDTIYVGVTSANSLAAAKLEGGSGTDTLVFEESGNNGTLTLTTGGATGFENLRGSGAAESLTGDGNANVLAGIGGSDTIYGLGGNDTLYAISLEQLSYSGVLQAETITNDILYGGAGDDVLVGSAGANILDGGTGKDTLTSGAGSDTLVLRAGDGGASVDLADVITDFADGTDTFGLSGSLTYNNLIITQGNGTDTSTANTVIKTSTEFLSILLHTEYTTITFLDFQQVL